MRYSEVVQVSSTVVVWPSSVSSVWWWCGRTKWVTMFESQKGLEYSVDMDYGGSSAETFEWTRWSRTLKG